MTAPVRAFLVRAGRTVRRRPWTTALVLVLVLVAGTGAGLARYAFGQWRAAQAAVREGRLDDAQRRLDVCLFVWPRSVPVRLLAARVARTRGDLAGAEAQLNRCLKLGNGSTEDIQLEFYLLRVQLGQADEVAPTLLKYVEAKHPDTPLILKTLARAYMNHYRYRPAFVILDLWIREAPDTALAYFWRGWVEERLHDSAGAQQDYEKTLELDPGLADARLRLAEMYMEKSNPPAALPHLERLRREHPERADVLARLGQCLLLQGKSEEARPLLEAAAAKLPDDALVLIHLGKLELGEDRPIEAETWLRRALTKDPYDQEALFALAGSLRLQGRREEAAAVTERYDRQKALLKRADELLKDEADHPSNDPAAAAELGALLLRIGQERLGEYWLHQAVERDPNNQPARKALAEYYEKKGDARQAAEHRRYLNDPDKKPAAGGASERPG